MSRARKPAAGKAAGKPAPPPDLPPASQGGGVAGPEGDSPEVPSAQADLFTDRLWRRDGWTARVIKNEDDDGWAVEMTRSGDPEPALVGPWTMGRDKKNPKPLDPSAFTTLVKTAAEVIRRHEHAARARLHREITFVRDEASGAEGQRVRATLDIAPDEDDPHATLACTDDRTREPLRSARVEAGFRLSVASVERFLAGR